MSPEPRPEEREEGPPEMSVHGGRSSTAHNGSELEMAPVLITEEQTSSLESIQTTGHGPA